LQFTSARWLPSRFRRLHRTKPAKPAPISPRDTDFGARVGS